MKNKGHFLNHDNRITILYVLVSITILLLGAIYTTLYQSGHIHVTRRLGDGSVFSGYWKLGEPFGEGRLITADGELVEGRWEDGKLTHGLVVAKEFTYNGQLKNYLPDGYGSCHYKDGSRYYGFWSAGKKQGLGKIVSRNDEIDFGIWEAGTLKDVKGKNYKAGQQVYGMDVSNHQKHIDWERLALYADSTGKVTGYLKDSPYLQPVSFVLIKSTEGADWQAATFRRNFDEAKRCGVARGAYHFLRLTDINDQIKNFIAHTPLEKGDLPPVLDMEIDKRLMKTQTAKVCEYAHKWLDAIEKHYGVKPMLYTYDSYYNDYLKQRGFEKYDFFIARYNPEVQPRVPHLEIWQFTEHGNVGGIDSKVDLDLFMGDYTAFETYVKEKGIQ